MSAVVADTLTLIGVLVGVPVAAMHAVLAAGDLVDWWRDR